MPMPETKPASAPCSSVRRKQSSHIGPTVAASRKPNSSPLRKKTVTAASRARARRELRRGKVVDAPEAGDEARVARNDAPEGEVRQLEVDSLFRKFFQPGIFQRTLCT